MTFVWKGGVSSRSRGGTLGIPINSSVLMSDSNPFNNYYCIHFYFLHAHQKAVNSLSHELIYNFM